MLGLLWCRLFGGFFSWRSFLLRLGLFIRCGFVRICFLFGFGFLVRFYFFVVWLC